MEVEKGRWEGREREGRGRRVNGERREKWRGVKVNSVQYLPVHTRGAFK